MPAIQPALLRQQAALLAEQFDDPLAYKRALHHLLDFYADRSRHPGKSGAPPPMITSYKVRPPVLRMILQELVPYAAQNPPQGLLLCDALWQEPYLEFKMLAAMLLGQIPPAPPEPVIGLLKSWLAPDLELSLVDAVIDHSLNRLRKEQPAIVVRQIQEWLSHKDFHSRQLGLRALRTLITDPEFQNMPVFYRLIQPLAGSVPASLRPDLLDVLSALAQRSPQETAFFLQQTLALPESQDTAWLIRQSLSQFPPELQRRLREAQKTAEAR